MEHFDDYTKGEPLGNHHEVVFKANFIFLRSTVNLDAKIAELPSEWLSTESLTPEGILSKFSRRSRIHLCSP